MERMPIPAASAVALKLRRGDRLRVIDPEGGQSGDLVAFSSDGTQRQSSGRTFDYGGKIRISTGDQIWSDCSEPMLTIVDDKVGIHDFLYAPCSLEMFRIQYGVTGDHPNCLDNSSNALSSLGIAAAPLPNAFNFFLHVNIAADGSLSIAPPPSRAGDWFEVRAEMDLAIAVSACPASGCNGGAPPRPLACEVFRVTPKS